MEKDRARLLRDNAFRSVKRHEPPRVTKTREKHGEKAARQMQIAIAMDEARKMGAE